MPWPAPRKGAEALAAGGGPTGTLHRATVINIKGASYRMKEKRLTGLFPGAVALPDPAKGGPRSKNK